MLITLEQSQYILSNFRSISLCNGIYKILSKVISNRLIKVLPYLISQNQCAFIKDRSASNNAMIGLEFLHQLHRSASNIIFLKLDLSKAFVRIEWHLVTYLLKRMNFPDYVINLINIVISITHISIKFNNTKTSYFNPFRGLQQGDPLSPLPPSLHNLNGNLFPTH